MYYYVLTVDKIQLPGLPHHYVDFVNWFNKTYPRAELDYHFEEGKQGRLHIHGMVKSPTKIYINRLRTYLPKDEYHLNFEFVRTKVAWDVYRTKDVNKEADLLSKWYAEEYDFYNPESPQISEEYIEIPKIRNLFSRPLLSSLK